MIGQVPAIGVCTFCNREFKVPLTAMKRVADSQESLRVQFTEHKSKIERASRPLRTASGVPALERHRATEHAEIRAEGSVTRWETTLPLSIPCKVLR
jgi:hypothetical protein